MKTILKIFVFLKVFGALMKRSKKKTRPLLIKPEIPANLIQIGSVSDSILKATVSVKADKVYINISGFLNEFDAMLWAKQQSILWNKELDQYLDKPTSSSTTIH